MGKTVQKHLLSRLWISSTNQFPSSREITLGSIAETCLRGSRYLPRPPNRYWREIPERARSAQWVNRTSESRTLSNGRKLGAGSGIRCVARRRGNSLPSCEFVRSRHWLRRRQRQFDLARRTCLRRQQPRERHWVSRAPFSTVPHCSAVR